MSAASVVGGVQIDLVMTPVPELPAPGGSRFVDSLVMRVGGAGANAALALAEAGMPVRLFGCVGEDVHGRWILGELGELGREVFVAPGSTGVTVACQAPERDRTFLTHLGVNATCGPWIVPPDGLDSGSVLVCDYFCAPALRGEPTRELLRAARERGARTFFDTAWDPDGYPAGTREEVTALLPWVDVFLPNAMEACALSGLADPVAAARALQAASGGWVVVKLGPDGCHAAGPAAAEHAVPAPAVTATDSTGAGDAFNAGLIRALAAGEAWPDALHAATGLASTLVARQSGARGVTPRA